MISLTRARRRLEGRRAVGFMFFMLVGMPILMFAFAWGIDATRIFIGQRQASRAAEAAAVAGAFQFQPESIELNRAEAIDAANETVQEWESFGALGLLSNVEVTDVRVTPFTGGPQTVTVEMSYNIGGLLFTGYFAGPQGLDADTERSATVCVPGDVLGNTQGFCQRPDLEGS